MTGLFAGVALALAVLTATPTPLLRTQKPEHAQPRDASEPTVTRFLLARDLTDTPRAFAQRLSVLVGAEVRLPEKVPNRLRLAAGAWTTQGALDTVARQINGRWHQAFGFKPVVPGTAAIVSRLPSAGRVTIHRERTSFVKMARAIAEEAGCVVELPKEVPPGRFSLPREAIAVEKALADLGAQAELMITTSVIFEVNETDPERALASLMEAEERRLMEEMVERANTITQLEEIVGADVNDEDFPWESIAGWVWAALDLSPEEVVILRQGIAVEREMQRWSPTDDPAPEPTVEPPPEAL